MDRPQGRILAGRHVEFPIRTGWRRGQRHFRAIHIVHAAGHRHSRTRRIGTHIEVIGVGRRITGRDKAIVGGDRQTAGGERKERRPQKCRHHPAW